MEDEGKELDKVVVWESGSGQPCEMASMPGFRFQPTEEELVGFYLRSMVVGHRQEVELINVLDLYRYDPWELPAMAFMQGEREWLFFCPRDKKYPNGARPNRVTASGYWKATGTDRPVRRSKDSRCIGLKKTLVFYTGKAPKGCKTEWIMNEYRLPQNDQLINCSLPNLRKPGSSKVQQKEVALCRIYKKSGHNYNILPTTTTKCPDADYCVPLEDHCTSPPSAVPAPHHPRTSCSSSNELEESLYSSTTDALLRRVLRDQLSASIAARSDQTTLQAAVSATPCNDPFGPISKHSVLEDMEEILEFGTRSKMDECTNSIHYHPSHQQALGNIAAAHPNPNYCSSLSPPNRLSDPIICEKRSYTVKLETGNLSSMLYPVNPTKESTADSIISTTVQLSPFTNYTIPDHPEAVIASLDHTFVKKSSGHVDVSSCVSASQMNISLHGIEVGSPDQAQVSWFRPDHVQNPQDHGLIFGNSSCLQPATCLHPSSTSLITLSSIDRLLKASMWSHI